MVQLRHVFTNADMRRNKNYFTSLRCTSIRSFFSPLFLPVNVPHVPVKKKEKKKSKYRLKLTALCDLLYPGLLYPDLLYPGLLYPDLLYPDLLYPDLLYPGSSSNRKVMINKITSGVDQPAKLSELSLPAPPTPPPPMDRSQMDFG